MDCNHIRGYDDRNAEFKGARFFKLRAKYYHISLVISILSRIPCPVNFLEEVIETFSRGISQTASLYTVFP